MPRPSSCGLPARIGLATDYLGPDHRLPPGTSSTESRAGAAVALAVRGALLACLIARAGPESSDGVSRLNLPPTSSRRWGLANG